MCQDDYIDASTNSPLYLMNQGGCPGYKSGSAAPSPSQGGGDPSVSCFYSKLKHCKSYFGVSTQTTGITMLVIVCIFLIADWNNWFWNAFSQVRIPWYQSITARLSTFTKMNDLSKKEASFWGDENPSLIRDLLDILPGVIILLLGLSVMGYVIPYAFRFPLNHEMNIPPYFIFCCMLVTNMITLVTSMITNMIMLLQIWSQIWSCLYQIWSQIWSCLSQIRPLMFQLGSPPDGAGGALEQDEGDCCC